jgi:hypothetical protein
MVSAWAVEFRLVWQVRVGVRRARDEEESLQRLVCRRGTKSSNYAVIIVAKHVNTFLPGVGDNGRKFELNGTH